MIDVQTTSKSGAVRREREGRKISLESGEVKVKSKRDCQENEREREKKLARTFQSVNIDARIKDTTRTNEHTE